MTTIYYIIEGRGEYTFSSVRVNTKVLETQRPQDLVPKGTEYAGHYLSNSDESISAIGDLRSYCDQLNNESSWWNTSWAN
jgi:hypothetical protein